MPAPAIVTGVPGWLGNRFVLALLNGLADVPELAKPEPTSISILANKASNDPFLNSLSNNEHVQIVPGDLKDQESLKTLCKNGNDATVFHIAGVIHPQKVQDFFSINTEGTRNILNAAIEAGARRFIYVSSNSPIGMNPNNQHLFDENSPYAPYMNYGKSKMLAEELVKAAQGKIETVILRPPWFYGPGQPPRQSLFFTMIKNGKVPIVGDGQNIRSMAYVDNICQGMLLAAKVEAAKNQIFWIADEKPYSMNTIVDTIEKLLERDFGMQVAHKRMHLPGIASEVAQAIDGSLQACGIYHQKMHVLSEMNKNIACSITKAAKELGYKPAISLDEGMRRSISWVLAQGISI